MKSPDVDDVNSYAMFQPRPGLNIGLNWSLADQNIHPDLQCFRNLNVEGLLVRSFGKIDRPSRAVHFNEEAIEPARFVSENPTDNFKQGWPASSVPQMSSKYVSRVQRELGYYLSFVPSSFVSDGYAGSSPINSVPMRIVTDNAVSSLFLRNMTVPVSETNNPINHEYKFAVLHAPGYRFTPQRIVEEFAGPSPADLGLSTDRFVITDTKDNRSLIGGVSDTALLMDSIAFLAGKTNFALKDSLVIPAHTLVTTADANVVMVVDPISPRRDVANLFESKNLYSAHHAVWNYDGVARLWNGICQDLPAAGNADTKNLGKGFLVEHLPNNAGTRLTRPLPYDPRRPNLLKHPKTIVFMVRDESGKLPAVSRLSAEEATHLYRAGLVSISKDGKPAFSPTFASPNFAPAAHPSALADVFADLVDIAKCDLFVCTTNTAADTVSKISSGKIPQGVPSFTKAIGGGDLASLITQQSESLKLQPKA